MRFLNRNHFQPKGKKKNRYVGIMDGMPRIITCHYHKDNDIIPIGTLSATAKQQEMGRIELIERINER